jgi:FkbH-like protein
VTIAADRDLREQAEAAIQHKDWKTAEGALRALWSQRPGPAIAQYLLNAYDRMGGGVRFPACRVKMLRSYTLEPLVPLLEAAARTHRVAVSARVGGLNAYAQEILNPDDDLYTSDWQAVVLAVHTRDVAPALWAEWNTETPAEYAAQVDEIVAHFRSLVQTFREHSTAPLVIHTLESPAIPSAGVLEFQGKGGQLQAIREINERLQGIAAAQRSVYVLDYDGLSARYGRERWSDERMWLSAKLPIPAAAMQLVVNEWLKFLCPIAGRISKVLVTDLDNTLWGGVIGEDGLDGICLENRYPGAAYLNVQRALLDLRSRGVVLAVASKNNPEDAMAALERHPNMLVRPQHLASWRMNWTDKAENLRSIAAELNVGIDSLAFLDDNPAERALIRAELPEVTVLEVADDPMGFARVIREAPELQRLELTDEDLERPRQYTEQRLRMEAEREAPTLESFYRSLKQTVEISLMTPATALRVAQLTQKTNQFNTTTRRYTEAQIAALANRPGWEIFTVRSSDRFGDNGLIGVAITATSGTNCEIDTLLLSCRVISRTIETAILAFLAERSKGQGVRTLQGWIVPTAKNKPARTVYQGHGFGKVCVEGERSLWSLDLTTAALQCPEWINLLVPEERALVEHAS